MVIQAVTFQVSTPSSCPHFRNAQFKGESVMSTLHKDNPLWTSRDASGNATFSWPIAGRRIRIGRPCGLDHRRKARELYAVDDDPEMATGGFWWLVHNIRRHNRVRNRSFTNYSF